MKKRCFKCGEEKAIREFYKHPQMKDGHLNKCKECTKKDSIENRKVKVDYYRAYDRARANLPYRISLRSKNNIKYRKNGTAARNNRNYRRRYPEKYHAHYITRNAIRDGKLIKSDYCEECGKLTTKLEAHHEDYSKPLSIKWLCNKCHVNTRRKYQQEA